MPPSLLAKVAAGSPTLGTHFMSPDPDVPEIIGDTGLFDYAEFCAEYALADLPGLAHLARAGQAGGLPLVIKPDRDGQELWAQAALGAGFEGVLFTDIRTPDDVREACRAVLPDKPASGGRMGVKLRRMAAYEPAGYLERLESVAILIMIEKEAAVADLDAVLAAAADCGVVMTQWGPADYSLSRGDPEFVRDPAIRAVEERVIAASLEHGIHPRVELTGPEDAARYVDLGVRHFCVGWDRSIYRAELLRIGEGMRSVLERT